MMLDTRPVYTVRNDCRDWGTPVAWFYSIGKAADHFHGLVKQSGILSGAIVDDQTTGRYHLYIQGETTSTGYLMADLTPVMLLIPIDD